MSSSSVHRRVRRGIGFSVLSTSVEFWKPYPSTRLPSPGITATGQVFGVGEARSLGGMAASASDPVVRLAASPDGKGYLVVTANGTVTAFADASFRGALPRLGVHVDDIVAIAPTTDGRGYWLAAASGMVWAFGTASYYGSLPAPGVRVDDIRAVLPASTGKGYVLMRGVPRRLHSAMPTIGWLRCIEPVEP